MMAHIKVEESVPGIRSLVQFRPETGKPIYELVQILLRGESSLSEGEREMIAAHVSNRNECFFCTNSHAAAARYLLKEDNVVDELLNNDTSSLSDKLKTLLNIAGKVQVSGKSVTQQDVDAAKQAGASDREIHDTVLIAATFSMCNRYVDGLAAFTPTDQAEYTAMGKRMGDLGYMHSLIKK